jgi:hypothetical protein
MVTDDPTIRVDGFAEVVDFVGEIACKGTTKDKPIWRKGVELTPQNSRNFSRDSDHSHFMP